MGVAVARGRAASSTVGSGRGDSCCWFSRAGTSRSGFDGSARAPAARVRPTTAAPSRLWDAPARIDVFPNRTAARLASPPRRPRRHSRARRLAARLAPSVAPRRARSRLAASAPAPHFREPVSRSRVRRRVSLAPDNSPRATSPMRAASVATSAASRFAAEAPALTSRRLAKAPAAASPRGLPPARAASTASPPAPPRTTRGGRTVARPSAGSSPTTSSPPAGWASAPRPPPP